MTDLLWTKHNGHIRMSNTYVAIVIAGTELRVMSDYVLPLPDRVSVGLDYLRVSYSADAMTYSILDRYMRSRADIMASAMYDDKGSHITLCQSSYGSGYRAGRHYTIVSRRDGRRITEIASGIGARYWVAPRRMVDASWRRVDVAIDYIYTTESVSQTTVDPSDVANEIINRADGVLRTSQSRRSITTIRSDSTTVYIGSRTSERMLRIYNKSHDLRAQQIDEKDAIVRVEIELKSRGCSIVDPDLIARGDTAAYVWAVVAYVVRTYKLPPMECPVVPPVYNPRLDDADELRTLKWIEARVVPCLKRLAVAGYGEELKQLGIMLLVSGTALETEEVVDSNIDGDE